MVRFKNRYIVVEVAGIDASGELSVPPPPHPDGRTPDASSVAAHIRASLASCLGAQTAAEATHALAVKYANASTGMCIVRVAREHVCAVWAALTMTQAHPAGRADGPASGLQCVWGVRRVAGTMRSAQRAVAHLSVSRIRGSMRSASTPAERAQLAALMAAAQSDASALASLPKRAIFRTL